ncbi:MAG: hypothetical protein KGH61_00310 [Candidatus Micrarchaeota archaeon]|nr:hypothetical protein [Candidatus Micrarchaeota archaeon]MDE1847379.1 hypothetical protein [Candidatus Micrarchaeota archaeon]MDE1863994.1 hypothetical protein [Candidatus Micrarchaeota archaeon]
MAKKKFLPLNEREMQIVDDLSRTMGALLIRKHTGIEYTRVLRYLEKKRAEQMQDAMSKGSGDVDVFRQIKDSFRPA